MSLPVQKCRVTTVTACRLVRPPQSLRSDAYFHQAAAHNDLGIAQTSILALPILAVLRRFRWATILTVILLLECVVLAANGGKCPLTDLATRYTLDRAPNFDIYLPNWLARYNKAIFGALFVFSELIVVWRWRGLAVKQTAKAGALYFMLVFSAGFVLERSARSGCSELGVRTAERIEEPLMFGLSILAARWVVRRLRFPPTG